jgi:small GTP-binding protein
MLTELQPLHTSSQLYSSNTTPVYFHQLTIVQLTTVPGQVMYNGAKIQMLDLPGIIQGAKDGKGRGRQVIAVAKTCNLIFIVLDVNKPLTDKRVIEAELEGFGIRINKQPPNIHFKKKDKGGISITSTVALTHIDNDVGVFISLSSSSVSVSFPCPYSDLVILFPSFYFHLVSPSSRYLISSLLFHLVNLSCCYLVLSFLFHPVDLSSHILSNTLKAS